MHKLTKSDNVNSSNKELSENDFELDESETMIKSLIDEGYLDFLNHRWGYETTLKISKYIKANLQGIKPESNLGALDVYQESELELKCQLIKSRILRNEGNIQQSLVLAEEVANKAYNRYLEYRSSKDQFGISQHKFLQLNAILFSAQAHYQLGRYKESLNCIGTGNLLVSKFSQDEKALASPILIELSNTRGRINEKRGDINKALSCYQKSLERANKLSDYKIKNYYYLAQCYEEIGKVLFKKNELKMCIEFYQRALEYYLALGNKFEQSSIYFMLIRAFLSKSDIIRAEHILQDLETITQNTRNPIMLIRLRLANALIFSEKPRLRDKAEAEKILSKIEKENIEDHEISLLVRLKLTQLLLQEYKALGEEIVYKEVQDLIKKMRKQTPISIEGLILQSKFSLIEGDLEDANAYLNQALRITKEKGLNLYQTMVTMEKEELTNQMKQLKTVYLQNLPVLNRIEETQVFDYLKEVQKLVSSDFSLK